MTLHKAWEIPIIGARLGILSTLILVKVVYLYTIAYSFSKLSFMPTSSPLDMPLKEGRVQVRQAHSSFFELLIGGTNLAFILLFTVTAIWGTIEDGFTLFLFVPYIFALVIAVCIMLFLWDWRKATLEYEQTGEIQLLEENEVGLPIFMAGVSLFFWGIYVLFFGYNLLAGNFSSWTAIIRSVLLLLPGIILGPLQYIYLMQVDKLRKFTINHHKINP